MYVSADVRGATPARWVVAAVTGAAVAPGSREPSLLHRSVHLTHRYSDQNPRSRRHGASSEFSAVGKGRRFVTARPAQTAVVPMVASTVAQQDGMALTRARGRWR